MDEDDDTEADNPIIQPLDPPDIHSPTQTQIRFHSLSGHLVPETLRLLGSMGKH